MAATAVRPDVLVVSQYYRPEAIGSAPFCGDLAESLAASGMRVRVVTARPHYPDNAVYPGYRNGERDRETLNGVEIARVPTYVSATGSALHRLAGEGSFAMRGGRSLLGDPARGAPLVVSLCPSILAVALGGMIRRNGARHVALVHDIQSGLAGGLGMTGRAMVRGLQRLERAAFNRCDLVIVLSEEMRHTLRAAGVRAPIRVHPIWIDVDAIQPRPSPAGPARVALYSGNFGRKQGLMQLVDLAQELLDRGSDLRVVLRGRGSQSGAISQAVAARRLRNVEFGDLLPSERMADGLAEGDIHLVPQDPSVADYAVPSKIYAIMAAARPFVATANEGSTLWRFQRESGAFICVPPNDPSAIAGAVMGLAGDPQQRAELGRRGREWVTAHCAKDASLKVLAGAITAAG